MMIIQNIKKMILHIPGGSLANELRKSLFRLPELEAAHIETRKMLNKGITNIEHRLTALTNDLASAQDKINQTQHYQDILAQEITAMVKVQTATPKASSPNNTALFAENHLLDVFYSNFEDRFRGNEDMIGVRVAEHLHLFKDSSINFKKYPVLDIGSGRGEFLRVLKNNGITALGIDINHDMVQRAKKVGLKAVQGDAIGFLERTKVQQYGAITGFHIVEHIPFESLLSLFKAAYTSLVPDGFVLFETPNPENILVATNSFYLDPSHLHPIPSALLEFSLQACGFRKIDVISLHPSEGLAAASETLPIDIANRLYGPQDYAVVAYK